MSSVSSDDADVLRGTEAHTVVPVVPVVAVVPVVPVVAVAARVPLREEECKRCKRRNESVTFDAIAYATIRYIDSPGDVVLGFEAYKLNKCTLLTRREAADALQEVSRLVREKQGLPPLCRCMLEMKPVSMRKRKRSGGVCDKCRRYPHGAFLCKASVCSTIFCYDCHRKP